MEPSKLLKLLADDESPKLDFKLYLDLSSESSKKELTKDIIAIANSYGGRGHLIIGIEDKTKRIVGIDPNDYYEEKIQQIVLNRCDPPIAIRVEDIVIEQKHLVVITIFKSHNRPHQMRQTGAFYIRRGSTTDYARRDEIATMLQQNGLMYDELMPIYNGRISHFNLAAINRFLEKTTGETYRSGQEAILCDVGICYHDREDNNFYPTIGGMMLFGKHPQQLLPSTGIKLVHYSGKGQLINKQINGTIIEMLDSALSEIKSKIKDENYPIQAVEEALGNALVHRDYFDTTRQVLVVIGEQSIEITNPGSIYDQDPVNNVINSLIPKRRNNWVYHQLIILDKHRRFTRYGRGMHKIKEYVSDIGKVKFINMRRRNLFKVILPGVAKRAKHKQANKS